MEGTEPQANKLLSSVVSSDPNGLSFGPAVSTADTSSSNGQAAVAATGRVEKKMFVGRVPVEATAEDLHAYFSQFGLVLDVYLPKVKTSLQSMSSESIILVALFVLESMGHTFCVLQDMQSHSLFSSLTGCKEGISPRVWLCHICR